jgi:hypothetical protein
MSEQAPETSIDVFAELEAQASHANELLRIFIARKFREQHPEHHLSHCHHAMIFTFESADQSYGCASGCDYASLDAVIGCDCFSSEPMHFTYGEFGDLASLVSSLEEDGEPWNSE